MLKKLFPREEIGIDLGTANTLIYKKGTGIVLNEPTMITIHRADNRVIAIGKEAADMMGKTADPIEIIRPMRDGVIAQYKLTGIMLKGFIQAVIGRRARLQTIIISIPVGCTDIETMAVKRTLEEIAPNKVHSISQPLAAAIGGGINIKQPVGRMVIDVGGGTTQIAIISALGVVISKTMKVGGDALTDAIARFVKHTHKVAIGEKIAEEIKFNIGNVHKDIKLENYQVNGLNLITGKPIVLELTA